MTISVRLDPDTETALRDRLRQDDVLLSAFVREAIREKLARADAATTPYAIGETLFGRYGSGDSDRSERRKELIRQRIAARRGGR